MVLYFKIIVKCGNRLRIAMKTVNETLYSISFCPSVGLTIYNTITIFIIWNIVRYVYLKFTRYKYFYKRSCPSRQQRRHGGRNAILGFRLNLYVLAWYISPFKQIWVIEVDAIIWKNAWSYTTYFYTNWCYNLEMSNVKNSAFPQHFFFFIKCKTIFNIFPKSFKGIPITLHV